MRFSVWPGLSQPWSDVVEVVRHAEDAGWDGVYVADHFMPMGGDLDQPVLECWAAVSALAAVTGRVRIGTLVCGNTYRHPAVLANQAAASDVISGGRIVLGLGAGWQENEHEAYGLDFGTLKSRMDRWEEACQVVLGLLRQDRASFEGRYYQLVDAPCAPRPVGPLPLLLGGGGEQRSLRIVARYADEWNVWSTPEVMAQKSAVLADRCEEIDRDPATIHRSTQALLFMSDSEEYLARFRDSDMARAAIVGTPAQVADVVAGYRDAGVDELIVPDFTLGSGTRRLDTLDQFLAEVAAHFR